LTTKNAIPIPNNIKIRGILPSKTEAVLEEISPTIEIGIVIYLSLRNKADKFLDNPEGDKQTTYNI
jgi:hypothetical protein